MMKTYGNQGGLRAFTRSLLAVAGFAAVAAPGSAFALDKVSFIADWFPEAEHGCYYQAKADGTYEKAGLDVEIGRADRASITHSCWPRAPSTSR